MIRACPIAIGAALLALAVTSAASALDTTARLGPVEARVTLLPDDPVIGDAMTLTIEAIADDGVELLMPEFGDALDRFQIVDFVPREELDVDGNTIATQRYTLRAPMSGEHVLPSILIEFVDRRPDHDPAPEGQDAYELLTDPLSFSIESLVVDAAAADLSPPLGELEAIAAGSGPVWPWLLAAAAVLAIGGPIAFRVLQRWSARSAQISAHELAMQKLEALKRRPAPGPDEVDDYFVALSSIVRHYLEDRFRMRSPELTTERFIELVSGSPDLRVDHQELLRDFLRRADLVKFAHHIPSPETIDESLQAAIQFVEDTRDIGESLPGAAAAAKEA